MGGVHRLREPKTIIPHRWRGLQVVALVRLRGRIRMRVRGRIRILVGGLIRARGRVLIILAGRVALRPLPLLRQGRPGLYRGPVCARNLDGLLRNHDRLQDRDQDRERGRRHNR
jgi:hypothetical protein